MLRELSLLVRDSLEQYHGKVLHRTALRLTDKCVVKKLQYFATLIEDGWCYVSIDVFERLEPCFQSREFLGCLRLTSIGSHIEREYPCTGRSEKRRFYIIVFELAGQLVEFGTDTDGIEYVLILGDYGHRKGDSEDQEKTEI